MKTNFSVKRGGFVASVAVSVVGLMVLGGCAGSRAGGSGGGGSVAGNPDENAVMHTVTAADLASAKGSTPVASKDVVLWINGMGCPQCVTNVDLQLERIDGAKDVRVDLANGKVAVRFEKEPRPTPDRIAKAVSDAGLTLVKIESGQ
ncbi:MAG: heavy-metal-associated domain-containing protein [Phycisphaerales bacterium]|nr:heavy-metal-associated domain-containing protein [Phycisphaerales bacterium]